MKKILSIIAVLTVCTILTACSSVTKNGGRKSLEGLELVRISSYTISTVKSFEDLERESELIVIGEFIDDPEVCYKRYSGNSVAEIASLCPMKITKVLAGDADIGDVVNVFQKSGIYNDKFITSSKLTPMQNGDEWVFCLWQNSDERIPEGYWCVSDNKGRYPAQNSASNEVMCFSDSPELGVYDQDDFQEEFYNKLLEKYGEF